MSGSPTIQSQLQFARQQLAAASNRLDAEVLLSFCLNKPRSHLIAWPDKQLSAPQIKQFHELLQQRIAGLPVSYLTGQREFWSLDLQVTQDVLIPRPDTEILVETTLARLPASKQTIADLGTGSGAIAIALASERPNWRVIATDESQAALDIAQKNAATHQLGNIEFLRGNWCDALPAISFDAIISNPPYIETADPHLKLGDVRFEPLKALASGLDGLDDIRHIVRQASGWLKSDAWLMLEHGYQQSAAVRKLLEETQSGMNMKDPVSYQNIESFKDLADNDRVTIAQMAS